MFGGLFKTKQISMLEVMKEVFTLIDANRLPWVVKNIDALDFTELTELMAHAHIEILKTPCFSVQAYWYSILFGTRNSKVQATLVNVMLVTPKSKITNIVERHRNKIYKINTTYVVNNYSINFTYFVDSYNSNNPNIFWYSLFVNGIYDEVLTPTFLWNSILKSFGTEKISIGFKDAFSMKEYFPSMLDSLRVSLTNIELNVFLDLITINAERYGWHEMVFEVKKDKSFNNNIFRIH